MWFSNCFFPNKRPSSKSSIFLLSSLIISWLSWLWRFNSNNQLLSDCLTLVPSLFWTSNGVISFSIGLSCSFNLFLGCFTGDSSLVDALPFDSFLVLMAVFKKENFLEWPLTSSLVVFIIDSARISSFWITGSCFWASGWIILIWESSFSFTNSIWSLF